MNAIILFTKVPQKNFSKTRLMPHLSGKECEKLQEKLIIDNIRTLRKWRKETKGDYFVFYTPKEKLYKLKNIIKDQKYENQIGQDIGDKMHNAFVSVYKKGYDKIVLIGSDILFETLDFELAFESLDENDCVITKTIDGGYCLIGLRKPNKKIFEIAKYSTDSVLEDTKKKVKSEDLKLKVIGEKRDIDNIEDLREVYFQREIYKNKETIKYLDSIIDKEVL